jgi:AraC family transcriptional regulator of adaptative response/methylated-DNA-[protein]-cysteine methyltransferase
METQEKMNYERIAKAIEYLSEHFLEQPDLDEVAAQVHLSPFHFQRLFTAWAGVSPKKFLQYLTTSYLKDRLTESANLIEAAEWAGLSSQSRVYDLFVNIEAVTPNEFRNAGAGLTIQYGYHDTPFGKCFIAVTSRGVCGLSFVEEGQEQATLEEFKQRWAFASIVPGQEATVSYVHQIFPEGNLPAGKLQLLVQGTNFQVKVWQALLQIPPGAVSTYRQIARSIGHPNAFRAVGTAIGHNPVAWLIPCHRVIRQEGIPGEYHWGTVRKKAIIGWEMAKQELKQTA